MRSADPASKALIEEELVHCVTRSLKTKDSLLWKPYNYVRTNLPPVIAKVLPRWQNPTSVRCGTLWWFLWRGGAGSADVAPSGLFQRATPVFCNLARKDPHPEIRQMATVTLGGVGTFTPEAFQIMLRALSSTDPELITAGARWFQRQPLDPERVVPLLVRSFEDPLTRSDCASALRAYGLQARAAVAQLVTLAESNDPYVSSKAKWVLEGIDPVAAKKARVALP